MRKWIFNVLLLFLSVSLNGQMIRIGLFANEVVTSLAVYCTGGEYLVRSGETRLIEFDKGEILFLSLEDGKMNLHTVTSYFGKFDSLEVQSLSQEGTFRLRPLDPALASRSYDDDLLLFSADKFINIVNRVDFDKYISGVLETEVGPNAMPELYKAHALLTRTYMLKNFNKHQEEGFSLCDGVHCQAYHGRSVYNPEIREAVCETTGEIVADYHYKLITAVYHSNSGGETQRASDVWLTDTDYLQAVLDPHSLHESHSKWYDTLYFDDWKKYLLDHGMKSVAKIPNELLYIQQRHRKKYFILDGDSLLMTQIREDWGFRSTFFNMFPESGGRIVVWGKGYGHGVGLSQEGAMKMAELGYNYQDIIKFYFYNIRIMDFEDLPASSLPDLEIW